MAKRRSNRSTQQRTLIAQTAARIMAEQGVRDFHVAKSKAAGRLGVSANTPNMPRNTEIEAALYEYLRLFRADSQPRELAQLRQQACEAMRFFAEFRPRLVGPVLRGVATGDSRVSLHLFADTPEQIVMHLVDRDIPHEMDERRVRLRTDLYRTYPVFRFQAGGATIDVTVFEPADLRQPPLSPVDGKPMQRASLTEVEALLDGDPDAAEPLVG